MMGGEALILLKATLLPSKSSKQAEKGLAALPTTLSNNLLFAVENAEKRGKIPVWVVCRRFPLDMANWHQIRRICYPDHRFSGYFGALSCLGRQGKDGRSIKSWPYGPKDFEVLHNSRGWRLFTCGPRTEYFHNGQIWQNKSLMCAPRS
jgi:hypothetical protein